MSLKGPQGMPPSSRFSGDIKHPRPWLIGPVNKHSQAGGRLAASPQSPNSSLSKSPWDFKASCLFALPQGSNNAFPLT